MQFYAIVPLLFYLSQTLTKHLRSVYTHYYFNIALVVASFWFQSIFFIGIHTKYMLLLTRLWQFALGFLAYDLRKALCKGALFKRASIPAFQRILQDGTSISLLAIGLLTINIGADQDVRTLTTVLAFLVILLGREGTKTCLTSRFLVWLGGISYSIYLVHWPLIVAHKFYHQRMYRGGALSVPCEFKTF
jgi:peptidoglycan/LPS O-acetylase OafA/YrhL